MSELNFVDAGKFRQGCTINQPLGVMYQSSARKLKFKFYFALELYRNIVTVFPHTCDMQAKRVIHIVFKLFQCFRSHDTRNILIGGSSAIVPVPVDTNLYFSHNYSFLWQGGYFHPACFQMLFNKN